jgi:hypothetical protein
MWRRATGATPIQWPDARNILHPVQNVFIGAITVAKRAGTLLSVSFALMTGPGPWLRSYQRYLVDSGTGGPWAITPAHEVSDFG